MLNNPIICNIFHVSLAVFTSIIICGITVVKDSSLQELQTKLAGTYPGPGPGPGPGLFSSMASQHASEQHHTDAASDKLPETLAHTKDEEDVVSEHDAHNAEGRDVVANSEHPPVPEGPGPPPVRV